MLGISNLTQVRAQNLNELIYKQGQAGVTKASVTIVFDNSNPELSPHGYEQLSQITVTRQIAIGGRNKYMINGHSAQLQRVQNLFHSVQLNVNNPHFLIMQGRITKVLNMKPIEILGMIEEAAGTRMFETKKRKAIETIEKKETKIVEINRVMDEDISPRLEKLSAQRNQYLEYTTLQTEVETNGRVVQAYDFVQAEENANKMAESQSDDKEQKESLKQQLKDAEKEDTELKKKLTETVSACTRKTAAQPQPEPHSHRATQHLHSAPRSHPPSDSLRRRRRTRARSSRSSRRMSRSCPSSSSRSRPSTRRCARSTRLTRRRRRRTRPRSPR